MHSCSSSVLVEKAAEQVASLHSSPVVVVEEHRRGGWIWRIELECPMRAVGVVVLDVHAQDLLQVPSADNQQPVQAFGADGADPPLGVGIGVGCLHWCQEYLGAFGAEYVIEGARELRVAISEHKLQLPALLLQHQQQVASLLGGRAAPSS
jgi:hypothetical protein